MITSVEPQTIGSRLFSAAANHLRVNLILDHAIFFGHARRGDETVELWELRKPIPGHPVGSVVERAVLDRHLFPESSK